MQITTQYGVYTTAQYPTITGSSGVASVPWPAADQGFPTIFAGPNNFFAFVGQLGDPDAARCFFIINGLQQ
jgi:hypothetical protein